MVTVQDRKIVLWPWPSKLQKLRWESYTGSQASAFSELSNFVPLPSDHDPSCHKVKTQSSSPKRHRYQDPGGLEFSSADSHASSPHKLPLVDYHSSSQRLSDIPQPFWHKSAKFSWKQCFTKVSSVQSKQYGEEYTWPSISISWVSALLLPTKQSEESWSMHMSAHYSPV